MTTREHAARGRATVRPLPRTNTGSWLNLLQAAITIAVALGVAASAVLTSRASGAWHNASRQEIKWSAAVVEDLRYVYGDEAPLALTVTLAESRAAALRLATGADGGLAAWEATAETQTAWNLRQAQNGTGGLLDGDRYRVGGGYDVARRLAAVRAQNPSLRDLNPAAAMAAGDAAMRQAVTVGLATLPLVVLFVLLQATLRWSGARAVRRGTRARSAGPDIGLVPSADQPSPFGALALLGWILVTTLPAGVLVAGNQEQRAHAVATQGATKVSTAITASSVLRTFQGEGDRALITAELRGYARELSALDTSSTSEATRQTTLARADQSALPRLRPRIEAMTKAPAAASGVDARTAQVVTTTPAQWEALRLAQNRAADRAEAAGQRGDLLQAAVLLASLSSTLALLSLAGPAPALIRRGAAVLLASAAVTAAAAYLV
jgi:hypothetical protein